MAQLGFARAGIVLVSSLIVGCGGGVADPAAGDTGSPTPDSGPTDTPVGDAGPVSGWASYTGTIVSVTRTWTGPSPAPKEPSKGWTGRIDLNDGRDVGSTPRAIILPEFADGRILTGTAGASSSFTSGEDEELLSLSSPDSYGGTTDRYDTLTVTFGVDGRAVSASLKGRTEVVSGDSRFTAEVVATLTLVPDAVRPKWRAVTTGTFAPIPLPWDQHTFEASEPYEGTVSTEAFFGSTIATTQHPIGTFAHGVMAERGVRFELRDWDLSGELTGRYNEVRDFAGNGSDDGASVLAFGGAKVTKRASSVWQAGDDAGAAYLWGATETTTGCRDGKTCVQIGPFKVKYCSGGSKGGLATRLAGSGTSTTTFRVVAKPSYVGLGAPKDDVMRMRFAFPSGVLVADTPLALEWPATPGSDGSFDTGWISKSVSLKEGELETGIAISGGGLGPSYGDGCILMPPPTEWTVSIYVEQISVAGGK